MKDSQPIGIIVAVQGEVENLKKQVLHGERGTIGKGNYLRGKYRQKDLVIAQSGAGISRARSVALEMVEKFSPRIILSSGSCGGLKEGINKGEVVIGEEIIFKHGGISSERENADNEVFYPENHLNEKIYSLLKESHFTVHKGKILSIGRFIYQTKTKEMLRDRFNTIAVEMDSGGIAQVAKQKGLPFIAVRVVSDELRGKLVDYNRLADYNGNLVFKKIIPYFFKRPWEAFWAIRFNWDLRQVYNILYKVQEKIIEVI
jgi:adenosylhomocysteine nucleosidase